VTAEVAHPRHVRTIEGGRGGSVVLRAGQRVHVVNTLGYQVVDTWALRLDGTAALSMSHSRLAMGRLSPRVGDTLVDGRRVAMLTLVADDSGGVHDTLIAACDPERYRALGFRGWHASCADNFRHAVEGVALNGTATGVGPAALRTVPDPLNLFMAVEASPTGELSLRSSVAAPGSRVILQAHQDVVVVVSACPQDLVPINGNEGPPRLVDLYVDDATSKSGER
jgi:uncharacterized protein YcgI (DUF1989 family)